MPYNPFAGWRITGTWANHVGDPPGTGYSLGGEDYPLPYGTRLPAPAAGTLRTSGGSGEFKAGQVGSAGRRSILMLDTPIRDVVAVVFQHQSLFGAAEHYDEGETVGLSGASANGSDRGGDVHLHIHCLTAGGSRRKFTDYFTGVAITDVTTAGGKPAPITESPQEEDDMDLISIICGFDTGAAYPYVYNDLDGQRHYVTPSEIFAMNYKRKMLSKPLLVLVNLPQADFDGIPKRAGARDYDGSIQPYTTKDWDASE